MQNRESLYSGAFGLVGIVVVVYSIKLVAFCGEIWR